MNYLIVILIFLLAVVFILKDFFKSKKNVGSGADEQSVKAYAIYSPNATLGFYLVKYAFLCVILFIGGFSGIFFMTNYNKIQEVYRASHNTERSRINAMDKQIDIDIKTGWLKSNIEDYSKPDGVMEDNRKFADEVIEKYNKKIKK
ncbi:MAG: hypothetical protein ACRC0V_09390 [Fusobacteriaceae bacterium]